MENNAFYVALSLLLNFDASLIQIVALSLQVSLLAVLIAALLGFPLGAAVALWRFPGRGGMIVLLNALMGLPPVVVGLVIYLASFVVAARDARRDSLAEPAPTTAPTAA